MKRSLTVLALALVISGAAVLGAAAPVAAQQPGDQTAQPGTDRSVSLPVTAVTTTGVSFDGTFNLRRFSARDNQVFAVGTLDGTFHGVGTINDEPVRVTVQRIESSCQYFRLVLGPVNVDVTDVDSPRADANPVDMKELHFGVTADQSDDGLFGAVLCGVRQLIGDDGTADLTAGDLPVSAQRLAQILNRGIQLLR